MARELRRPCCRYMPRRQSPASPAPIITLKDHLRVRIPRSGHRKHPEQFVVIFGNHLPPCPPPSSHLACSPPEPIPSPLAQYHLFGSSMCNTEMWQLMRGEIWPAESAQKTATPSLTDTCEPGCGDARPLSPNLPSVSSCADAEDGSKLFIQCVCSLAVHWRGGKASKAGCTQA